MKLLLRKLGWLALPLMLVSVANAQTTELELGFRWLDLTGNEAMYRSQINEREGFVLRAFSYWSQGEFDRFRITANDLGTTPAGMLRLESERDGAYRLRLGYRTADAYSALPGFANPLLSQGVVLGQHTFDQTRTFFDLDVEFVPDRKIVPFIGYSRNEITGPRRTTYHLGQDEFRLLSDLEDLDQEVRGGVTFNLGRFYGQVTQGWRDFGGTEVLVLDAGAGSGNNVNPILGRPVSLETLNRTVRTDVTAPFTNAVLTGQISRRMKIIGSFVQFSADLEGKETESATGSLISFPLSRFFGGISEGIDSAAESDTWRGEGRVEFALTDTIDLLASYRREDRQVDGTSLIASVFEDTITFGGADLRNIEEVLDTKNALSRDEQVLSATVLARALGPFAVRAGYSESDQEVVIKPDLSEIVLDGEGGTFNRRIQTLDTLVTYSKNGFTLGASWRNDRADDAIFRTDFLDRDRYRVRSSWAFRDKVRIGATAEQIDQLNDNPDTGFDGSVRQYSADIEVTPLQMLQLRASASQFKADTEVLFMRPADFTTGISLYAEEGTGYEGGFSLFGSRASFDADYGQFDNEGSVPFTIDRYRGRIVYDFMARAGVAAEFWRDEYTEEGAPFADFEATRYGVFLRLRR